MRVEWVKHASKVKTSGQWRDEELTSEEVLVQEAKFGEEYYPDTYPDNQDDAMHVDEMDDVGRSTAHSYLEIGIQIGEKVTLALGHQSKLDAVRIMFFSSSRLKNMSSERQVGLQKGLCYILSVCDMSGNYSEVPNDRILIDPDTGLAYIDLELSEITWSVFGEDLEDVEFAVQIRRLDGQTLTRRFAVDGEKEEEETQTVRQKRESGPWSGWTYYSIPDEHLFPDYGQHKMRDGTAVGCGPVAWAMIFGYLDRRSHYNPGRYSRGSQGLYRSGSDGTWGSNSERAPSYSDVRMRRYTERVRREINSFGIFRQSATWPHDMDNVEDFFRVRQTTGSPRVRASSWALTWTTIYYGPIAEWTGRRIREGWPVIVGYHIGGLHYPVATKWRTRTRRTRHCVWFICFAWFTERNSDMYLHMGWGGRRNGWYSMDSWVSLAAVY